MKQCARCGKVLPTTHFYKNPRNSDGLQSWCKTCFKDYAVERVKQNPTASRIATRKYRQSVRERVFEKLGGAVCSNCGCSDIRILELNHINGGGQKEIRKYGGSRPIYQAILRGDLSASEYNVLCRVCNAVDFVKRKFGITGFSIKFKHLL